MLDAVREEKKSFEKARLLYMKGFLDDKASMSPNELILFARNRAFEKKVRVERNVKYGKDLIKGLKMEHFLADQQEVNQALSKADEIPLCMLRVNAQFFSGDAVNGDAHVFGQFVLDGFRRVRFQDCDRFRQH